MAQDESVEAVEAVFGEVQGQLAGSSNVHNELLPFLFSFAPKDAHHLRLCVSDFHSQTWQSELSVSQLQCLRSDAGIGGGWDDFLTYLRTSFLNNVELILGGLADSIDSFKSSKLVVQKAKGLPRVSIPLEKLEGSAAEVAKASIALGNFKAFLASSSALVSEKAQVASLKALLSAEKAKAENLQEQINVSNRTLSSRKKLDRNLSALPASQLTSLPSTQLDTQVVLPSLLPTVSDTLNNGKEVAAPKAPGSKTRVHVAPTSRRVKRRGTVIGERTDADIERQFAK